MLTRTIFSKGLRFNITLKINLSALRLNNQLPTFVSYKPDPNAYAADKFSGGGIMLFVWEEIP